MEDLEQGKRTKKKVLSYAAGIAFCLLYLAVMHFTGTKDAKETQMTEEELLQERWEKWETSFDARYGKGVKILSEEKRENDEVGSATVMTCRARDERTTTGVFYFTVYSYPMPFSNFFYQLMKNNAWYYWSDKEREFGFYSTEEEKRYGAKSDRWDTQKYPEETDLLWVSCPAWQEIDECALDIADWLLYASADGRFFGFFQGEEEPERRRALLSIWIHGEKNTFVIELPDMMKEIWADGFDRRQVQQDVADLIRANGRAALAWEYLESEEADDEAEEEWNRNFLAQYQGEYEKECELEDGKIRFRMVVIDAATGNRMYGLLKSTDGGAKWQVVSSLPFGERWGMGIDFTFLSEDFGFAALMHNGGDEAELFVTENGGESYEPVEMEEVLVTLSDGYEYNPYDYPQMPYEEDGKLYVLCGQGMDGDYAGGDEAGMALYESADHGHSFSYIGIKKP